MGRGGVKAEAPENKHLCSFSKVMEVVDGRKGAPGSKSWTGTQLVSTAAGPEKKNWTSSELNLKTTFRACSTAPSVSNFRSKLFVPAGLPSALPLVFENDINGADATPNGLAMNLPILHDISCISYKDYKGSK